jgi:chromosome segregation ATPase
VVALSPEQPLHIETRDSEDAAEHASLLLTTATRKIARYEKKLAAFRRRHRQELKAASDYRLTVSTQISYYNATRRNLQQYLDAVKDDNEAIPVFRKALQDARREREGVRAALAALTVPPPLAADHQRLVSLLDRAISATDVGVELADAVEELRDSGDYVTSGFDLPEYQRFVDLSDDITQERNATVASWQTAIEGHIDRLEGSKGGPRKPKI